MDPASTIITILVLASQAFQCAYQTIESFHNLPAIVISIKDELHALELVIKLVSRAAERNADAVHKLKPLLEHCTKESGRFSALIKKCLAHSSTPRRSLRDWGRLKLADKEIEDFRNLLGRAKLNINLAIGGLNLEGVTTNAGLIEEMKELIEKNSVEIKTHMKEVLDGIRELSEQGDSISDADRARWDELQAEKEKCEKEISALAEVSKQLEKIELDHLESVLNDERVQQNVAKALKRTTYDSLTVSNIRHFITKLPQLMHELTTRLSFVEREQENIVLVNKEMRERLQAEKKVDEICMENLEEITKKVNKSTSVLRNVHGAQDADQIFVSTFDQLLRCENISTGQRGRLIFGTMSEDSLKLLCRTRGTPVSPSTMQSSVPSKRENLLVLGFIGLLAIIGFNNLLTNHV